MRRVSWSLADQALSSASNFILSLLLLRYTTSQEFGAFTLAFSIYLLILSVARAACSTPLLIRGVGKQESRGALTVTLGISLLTAATIAPAAALTSSPIRGALLLFAVGLPALLIQDALRFIALAAGEPQKAFRLDFIWLLAQATLTGIVLLTHTSSLLTLTTAWLLGALLSALCGRANIPRTISRRAARSYLSGARDLIRALVPENIIQVAMTQMVPFIVAATLSLSAVGSIRAAQTVIGPASMVYMGLIPLVTVQARERVARGGGGSLFSYVLRVGTGLSGLTLFYGIAMVATPLAWLVAIFGSNINSAQNLLLPATLALSFQVLITVELTALRFLRTPRDVAMLRVGVTALDVAATVLGATTLGAVGALMGSTASGALAAFCVGLLVWRSVRANRDASVMPLVRPQVGRDDAVAAPKQERR